MEEKRLKQFTFYDLYYDALKRLPDEAAGRMAENICKFMFKLVDYLEKCLIYGNIRRFAD